MAGDARGPAARWPCIFGGAMFLFILLSAVVVDISWYWSSNLKMQRAAHSAALAGVVYLPGDVSGAYTTARNEAAKNGYSAAGGYTVTPVQDPFNTRRLNVTISGNIGTFFARVAGITSFPASRASKADFVLPVPMGSPQNYYGVGFYEGRVAKTTLVPGNTATDTGGSPLECHFDINHRRAMVDPEQRVRQRQQVHDTGHQRPEADLAGFQPPGRDPQ